MPPQPTTAAAPTAKAASPAAAKRRGRLTERELLAAFHDGFQRCRPGVMYQLGILLVSLTMIVLPLIYLASIALVIFAVGYHAMNNTAILHMGRGRSGLMAIGVYLAPIVAGVIAVFFMFKPLLARPSSNNRSRSLTRQSEPLLFAFVDRICEVVGARSRRESTSIAMSTPRPVSAAASSACSAATWCSRSVYRSPPV